MDETKKTGTEADDWEPLKAYTNARIALGKTGISIPLKESLQFRLAHAHAKDAVYSQLNVPELQATLSKTGLPVYCLKSKAENRDMYLQRPDFGRLLSTDSVQRLQQLNTPPPMCA